MTPMNKADETPKDLFIRVLGVEPKWAETLVENGFTTLEEVAYVPIDEFRSIDVLEEQQIQAWRARARHHLLVQVVGDGDDEDPIGITSTKPLKPLSGGAGANVDDNDDR